jgi:hypothetical protein
MRCVVPSIEKSRLHSFVTCTVVGCVLWVIAASLSIYPSQLAYFNELAGGPTNGHTHILGSALDWGQDLLLCREWIDKQSSNEPIHLAYYGAFTPSDIGLNNIRPFTLGVSSDVLAPENGWYIISVNLLNGKQVAARDGALHSRIDVTPLLARFISMTPAGTIGYSLVIYRIDERNRSHPG